MGVLIKNGRILDPSQGMDEIADIYVNESTIAEIGVNLQENAEEVIDAAGCYVMPGLIDLHVHLRDPGLEYKEDIETGSKAAAKGGFTTIVAMPNTKPVIDEGDRVSYVIHKAESVAPIRVLQAGAITRGQKGEELADIEGMVRAGVAAISEDGKSVMNARLCRDAMRIAAQLDIPVLAHCEDANLAAGGCMNDDENCRRLGLTGISNATEDVIAARDIALARETGVRLHLCHCSTRDSVEMVRQAKRCGVRVTAEVCPHHFTLTSDDIPRDDPNYKMNPPLRTREDVEALREGLADGTIDAISTDHAPHSPKDKEGSMSTAAFGIVGLETSVALTLTELVHTGILSPLQMAERMSWSPARILGIDRGTLAVGSPADITVIDPEAEYVIDRHSFVSKSKNTPFDGRPVKGRVKATICGGAIVYEA